MLRAIADLALFDADETRSLRQKALGTRNHWIARGQLHRRQFYTLGRTAYLDFVCSDDPELNYIEGALRENQILWLAFASMYERIRAAIENHIEPVRYTRRFALPGFYIFMGDAVSSAARAPVHFDGQYPVFAMGGAAGSIRRGRPRRA